MKTINGIANAIPFFVCVLMFNQFFAPKLDSS